MINILYLHAGSEMYGADKVLLELVKGIDRNSFNPIVILPSEGILVDKLREALVEVHVIPYPILRRKIFNPKGLITYAKEYLKYTKKIVDVVSDKEINIIHNNTTAVLEGIFIKFKLKIPLIWHIHEIIVKPKIVAFTINLLVGIFSDSIVCVSQAVKSNLYFSNSFNKNKTVVIYNGVDRSIYNEFNKVDYLYEELKISKNAVIVGMIGRVNSWKGQQDFVKALEPLMFEYDNLYGVLVGGVFQGEEWRFQELLKNVENSKYKEKFIVQNFRNDTANLHNLFDVFVLPSTNPDPLPTVVLEAMASKKPIVGYNHGGIKEMVDDKENGLLVEVRNVSDLSVKLRSIISNEKMMQNMSISSKNRQEKLFSLNSYIHAFSNLYTKYSK